MSVLATSRVLTIGLLLACGALGFVLFEHASGDRQTTLDSRQSPSVRGERPSATSAEIPDFLMPPLEQFVEITQRPLFNETRRPLDSAEDKGTILSQELNIMLSGVVIDKDRRFAHVRSAEDNRIRRLQQGDAIMNWRIESIEIDRVVLRAGARREILYLKNPGATNSGSETRSLKKLQSGGQARRRSVPTNPSREEYRARRRERER